MISLSPLLPLAPSLSLSRSFFWAAGSVCRRVLFGAYLPQTDQKRDISVVVDGYIKKKKKTEYMAAEMPKCPSALHIPNCSEKITPEFYSDDVVLVWFGFGLFYAFIHLLLYI